MFSFRSRNSDIEVRRRILRFINEQRRFAATCYDDQREESRSNLNIGALLVPIVKGEPDFEAVQPSIVSDMSTSGVGIIAPAAITAKEALVVLPGTEEMLYVQITIVHNRRIGNGFSTLGTRITNLVTPNKYPVLAELGALMQETICQPH